MSSPVATKALADSKAKRQKQILAVGSVILLALLGFQLPKLMGGSAAQSTAPTETTDASGLPAAASPLAAVPGKLPDTDRVVIEPGSGQLISFGLFKSKDPFQQQLSTVASPSAAAPIVDPTVLPVSPLTPTTTTSQPHTPPRRTAPNGGLTPVTTTTPSLTPASTVPFPSTTPVMTTPAVPTPVTTTPRTTAPAAPVTAPTSVAISTNGACESLAVNATFPGTEDIFRVLSIAKDGKSVKIGVVGGAYDSGEGAATLRLGQKLTLVNTADGTRYVLLLRTKCDYETQPVAGTATTGTSTVAAPTTTTTATTPIVTDALDTTTPGG